MVTLTIEARLKQPMPGAYDANEYAEGYEDGIKKGRMQGIKHVVYNRTLSKMLTDDLKITSVKHSIDLGKNIKFYTSAEDEEENKVDDDVITHTVEFNEHWAGQEQYVRGIMAWIKEFASAFGYETTMKTEPHVPPYVSPQQRSKTPWTDEVRAALKAQTEMLTEAENMVRATQTPKSATREALAAAGIPEDDINAITAHYENQTEDDLNAIRFQGQDKPGADAVSADEAAEAMQKADWEEETEKQNFPEGWDEERVKAVIEHYDNQTTDEAIAEVEAAYEAGTPLNERAEEETEEDDFDDELDGLEDAFADEFVDQ